MAEPCKGAHLSPREKSRTPIPGKGYTSHMTCDECGAEWDDFVSI